MVQYKYLKSCSRRFYCPDPPHKIMWYDVYYSINNIEYSRYKIQYRIYHIIQLNLHQLNPAGLLVHLQRQYNPSVLPVRSQGCTYNPTGLPVRQQGFTLRQTPNQNPPLNLSPIFRVLCFMSYILQETARLFPGSACFSSLASDRNLPSWVKYYGKFESFGKELWTKFIAVERVRPMNICQQS